MTESFFKSLGLDQYQRAAQLNPALLTTLPLSSVSLLWAPKASAIIGSLASVVASGAAVALFMQLGRARGRLIQKRLISEDGGLPSTVALRHRSSALPAPLRQRVHASLAKHGFRMPSTEEEADDPIEADSHYAAATMWLPDQMRDQKKFYLLHVENRSYGFRRNLLGLKPIGLSLTLVALLVDVVCLAIFRGESIEHQTAGAMLALLLLAGAGTWLWVVTPTFVRDAGLAYAQRQLAAVEQLPQKRAARASKPG